MESKVSALQSLLSKYAPSKAESTGYALSTYSEISFDLIRTITGIVGKEITKKSLSAICAIPTIDHAAAISRCIPFSEGYYDPRDEIYYVNDIYPQHLTEKQKHLGLLIGTPSHHGYTLRHPLLEKETVMVVPKAFSYTVRAGLVSRGTNMQKTTTGNARFLDAVYYNHAQYVANHLYWQKRFANIQQNIIAANGRTLHFLSGDGITETVREHQHIIDYCFIDKVGYQVDSEAGVMVLPISTIKEHTSAIHHAAANLNKHIILYSDTHIAPRFLQEIVNVYNIDFAIEFLNGFETSRAAPKLCKECRAAGPKGETIDDSMFNKIERLERHCKKGLGCEQCHDGYTGITWATESWMKPGEMSRRLLEYKNSIEFVEAGFSIHKLYDKLYSNQSATFSRSVKSLVEQGEIQVKDANKIML